MAWVGRGDAGTGGRRAPQGAAMFKENTMTTRPDVYLLRHGETQWNKTGRIQGQMNSDLTELGQAQAAQQGAILRRLGDQVAGLDRFASPLSRTQATARIAFGGAEFTNDARLIEIGCGAWEGITPAQRQARDPDLVARSPQDLDLYFNAPMGEGLPALRSRIEDFLNSLTAPAIIVSHKVSLIVMRACLTGITDEQMYDLTATQGTVIRISGGVETHLA